MREAPSTVYLGQRLDRADRHGLAGAHRGLDDIARHLGVDGGEAEIQVVLARDLANDLDRFREVRIAATGAGGADDEWDAVAHRADDGEREVALR